MSPKHTSGDSHNNHNSAHADRVHIIEQLFRETGHFFRLNAADICNAERVYVSEFSRINCKGELFCSVVQRFKRIGRSFRFKNCGNQVALIFFVYEHFQVHFLYRRNKDFPALCVPFRPFFYCFRFCFDYCLAQSVKCLNRRSEPCLLCFLEIRILVAEIPYTLISLLYYF